MSVNDRCEQMTAGMRKQAEQLLRQAYFRGFKDGEMAERSRNEPEMKTYYCVESIYRIVIQEDDIIEVKSPNWGVTEVKYPDVTNGQAIKKLIVTFEVKE